MSLLGLGVLLILLGGVAAIVLRKQQPRLADGSFAALVVAGCVALAIPALRVLAGDRLEPVTVVPTLPGGTWVIALDALSAWFLLVLAVVGGVTTAYGVRYLAGEREHRSVAPAHASVAVLLAAMTGVFVAQAAVLFLLVWELMAVSAYLLIVFEYQHAEVRRSGLIYLVLTHAGTLALLMMFLSWGKATTDLTFSSLARAAPALPSGGAVILLLALFGFGVKAGMFPLHFWLPGAHAAAPSHVSALLSGVMIKTGVYGLARVITLFGAPPAWWGWTLVLMALASAVLGVLWALAQHDLKRLLAYHSVENIGIILLGLGLGALGATYRQPLVAVLGFAGALLHTLNHSLFKSLLFLGAGVVARATGTREIDRLGGLARRIPRTALAFLVGSIAIVGLPPLNGFVSEWVIFQGLLRSGLTTAPLRMASAAAAGLALTGALALACFTKLHGTLFLGTPRDAGIVPAEEAERGLAWPQLVLAGACVAIGLLPVFVVAPAARAATLALGGLAARDAPTALARAAMTISVAGWGLIALAATVWGIRWLAVRRRPVRQGPTWGCAYPAPTPRMQYTASSFASPLLQSFGRISGTREERSPTTFHSRPMDPVLDQLGRPLWHRLAGAASQLRALQTGRIRWYLSYLILTLLGLLLYLGLARAR